MKKWFKTQNDEVKETSENPEEETDQKEPKKFNIPKPVKYGAAAVGLLVGAFGISRLFGGGSAGYEDTDWSEESDGDSDPEVAFTEVEPASAETAE